VESIWDIGMGEGVLHREFAWLVEGLDYVSAGIDLFAILLLLIGAVRFILGVARAELSGDESRRLRGTNRERIELGRYILAGLELLIVSDIIHTALSLAVADLVFLGPAGAHPLAHLVLPRPRAGRGAARAGGGVGVAQRRKTMPPARWTGSRRADTLARKRGGQE
jgi:uncharacterized membrane protein